MKPLMFLALIAAFIGSTAAATIKISRYDALTQSAIVRYEPAANGTWRVITNRAVTSVEGEPYAFDPKTNKLYLKNQYGNFVVEFDKRNAETYKKDKSIPHLSGMGLNEAIGTVTSELTKIYNNKNVSRQKAIADSMAMVEKQRAREAELAEAERQRKEAAQREERARQEKQRQALSLPIGGATLVCSQCDHRVSGRQSLQAIAVSDNKIYAIEDVPAALGTSYKVMHAYDIPASLASQSDFTRHLREYGDWLSGTDYNLTPSGIKEFNRNEARNQVNRLREKTPYGFLSDMSIDFERGTLTVHFAFTNLNDKTVAKLDMLIDYMNENLEEEMCTFTVKGPIERFAEADWTQRTSGLAMPTDEMRVEVTITYTDGQTVVLRDHDLYIDK